MSGWIKLEKDLRDDPRFLRMVRTYRNSQVTHHGYSERTAVTHLLGAVANLWMYADSHIREDDTLDVGTDEIDELVGIVGFAKLMPADWLEVIDANSVKLPGFQDHNGTEAKKKALVAKRVARHRIRKVTQDSNTVASVCNAHELPDQTRLDQKRPDQKRPDQKRPDQEEREAHAREGARGTVVDLGSNMTRLTAAEAFASVLEDWRRDVPECNADAFARWIVHVELSGKPMNPAMRIAQARRLAGNGDFAAQAEVIDFCCENGYRTLMPIGDVRARTHGMARTNANTARKSIDERLAALDPTGEGARELGA